jgi:hypothetical protein
MRAGDHIHWLAVLELGLLAGTAVAQNPAPVPAAFLKQYCIPCHNDKLKTAGLSLEKADLAHPANSADVWEKVIGKLRLGMMPPQTAPQPDATSRRGAILWLEAELDHAAAEKPNPGQPLLHRLNRTEYANAVQDLLGLKVDVAALLPPDDAAFGFDNNASVLGISSVLLERYLSAADRVSALAMADPTTDPGSDIYRARQDLSQDQHIEGLPFGTVGGMQVEHTFPLDAEYEFRLGMFRNNLEIMRGIERPHQVELSIDDERVFLRSIGGPDDLARMSNPTDGSDAIDARFRIRIPVKAGLHRVTATFVQKRGVGTARLQGFVRSSVDTFEATGRPHLESITILGPYQASKTSGKPSSVDFSCPEGASTPPDPEPCARRILEPIARRAYRRPVTEEDMQPLLEFFDRGRSQGSTDRGFQMA